MNRVLENFIKNIRVHLLISVPLVVIIFFCIVNIVTYKDLGLFDSSLVSISKKTKAISVVKEFLTIVSTMLGFIFASYSISLSLISSEAMSKLRTSKSSNEIWNIYKCTIVSLLVTSQILLLCFIFENLIFNFYIFSLCIALLIDSFLCVLLCFWVLTKLVEITFQNN